MGASGWNEEAQGPLSCGVGGTAACPACPSPIPPAQQPCSHSPCPQLRFLERSLEMFSPAPGLATWLATSGRRNQTPLPKLLLRKPALSSSSLTATAPQTISFLQCLSSPRAPWWVGRPRSSLALLQHWGGGAEGRVHHLEPFCWAGRASWLPWLLVLPVLSCCCSSQPTVTSQLPHHCLDVSPSPRGTPTFPPAVSSLPATLLLPGLSSGKGCSCLFWKYFLKRAR